MFGRQVFEAMFLLLCELWVEVGGVFMYVVADAGK